MTLDHDTPTRPRMTGAFDDGREVGLGELGAIPHAELVAALASWPSSVAPAEALAGRIGMDVITLWDALLEAEAGGWVDLWADAPQGPSATLSPRTAARLGLGLSSDGSIWLRRGQRDPTDDDPSRELVESDCVSEHGTALFDFLVDGRSLEGLDSIVLMELAARLVADFAAGGSDTRVAPTDGLTRMARAWSGFGDALDFARLPRPTLILGLAPTWPVRMTPAGPCPGCGSRPLGISALCLICLRSGLDHLLPEAEPLPVDRPEASGSPGGKPKRKESRKAGRRAVAGVAR